MEKEELTRQVYISHTQKEDQLAAAVGATLAALGIKVWDDQAVETRNWDREVTRALETSDSMIALLTANSFSSSWVRNELQHAFFDDRYKNRLLPVLIGDKSEEFVRLPWILSRLPLIRLSHGEPTPRQAKRIVDAFIDVLKSSKEAG